MLSFPEILMIIVVFCLLFIPRMLQVKKIDYQELETAILKQLNDNNLIAETTDSKIETILNYFHHISNSKIPQYKHYILLEDEINAMALPSGTILISKGFLENIEDFTEDEIASVLAHEIGHIQLGHAKSRIEDQAKAELFEDGVQMLSRNLVLCLGAKGLSFLSQQLFCRDQEYEADNYAVNLLHKSKYNPRGFVTLLEKFKNKDHTPKWVEIISTHPHLDERIENALKQLEEILSNK
jgi:predicted Zn-dependent protease